MNWFRKLRWWKKGLLLIFLAISLFCGLNCELVLYGIGQGKGQAKILWNARPIDEVLADPEFPDSLKTKLELIQQIREFAIDSLGLTDSDSYREVYDQKGQPILWVVTGCKPFALEDYKWDFPFLGELSYKGFFEKTKADTLAAELAAQGWDSDVGEVTAWSTLGWFDDPILTGMLDGNEGELARLIIHELTHATIYISDDVDFNENLATFVGDFGAYEFLKFKYGKASKQYSDYQGRMADITRFSAHVLGGAQQLEELYASFDAGADSLAKAAQKQREIQRIFDAADTISFYDRNRYARLLELEEVPNNCFFMGFKRYRQDLGQFEQEFKQDFGSDFKSYLSHLVEEYQ